MLTQTDVLDLIETIRPDGTSDDIRRAMWVFDTMNSVAYLDQYAELYSFVESNGLQNTELVDLVVQQTKKMLVETAMLQGFALSEDLLLSEAIDVVQALHDITTIEDPEMVRQMIAASEDDKTLCAELIEFVSVIDAANAMCMILRTPDHFKSLLKANYPMEPLVSSEEVELKKKVIENFRKYRASPSGIVPVYAHSLFQYEGILATPLDTLFNLWRQNSGISVEDTDHSVEQVANELFGLASLSGDYFNRQQEGCAVLINSIYPQIALRAKAMSFVRNNVMGLNNA